MSVDAGADIGFDDFVHWNPEVVNNVLKTDILSERAMRCFVDYKNKEWKPLSGYTARDFAYQCVYALKGCDTGMEEDAIYSSCARLAAKLAREQDKFVQLCKDSPESVVCSSTKGESCDTEGAFRLEQYNSSVERFECKDGVWKKMNQNLDDVHDISEVELQNVLYTRCVNSQIVVALGGEQSRYFDCDVNSRKCLIAIEANPRNPVTTGFCCKLFKDNSVALYANKSADGKIENLKQHLKLNQFCPNEEWLNE